MIEITPTMQDCVRMSFTGYYTSKKHPDVPQWRCILHIGTRIIHDLGWETGDYIRIGLLTQKSALSLEKTIQYEDEYNLFKGYKLHRVVNSYSYGLRFKWDQKLMETNLKTPPYFIKTISYEAFPEIAEIDKSWLKVHYQDYFKDL